MSGPLVPGNVNLYRQPKVLNPDGSISTVDSSSYGINGVEVLLPSVTEDGRHLSDPKEIVAEYFKTGRHLGKFATPEDATAFGKQLHKDYAAGKYDVSGKPVLTTVNGMPMQPAISHKAR